MEGLGDLCNFVKPMPPYPSLDKQVKVRKETPSWAQIPEALHPEPQTPSPKP